MLLTELILRTVIDKVDHAIIIADNEGNFTLWNDTAKKILNLKGSIKDYKDWSEHFTIFKMDGVRYNNNELPIMKAINGESVNKERLYITDGSGTGSYLEVDTFPIKDDKGNTLGAVASFTDVSKNVKMEMMIDDLTQMFLHMKNLLENSFFK